MLWTGVVFKFIAEEVMRTEVTIETNDFEDVSASRRCLPTPALLARPVASSLKRACFLACTTCPLHADIFSVLHDDHRRRLDVLPEGNEGNSSTRRRHWLAHDARDRGAGPTDRVPSSHLQFDRGRFRRCHGVRPRAFPKLLFTGHAVLPVRYVSPHPRRKRVLT